MVAVLSNLNVSDPVDKRRRSPRTIVSPANYNLVEELTCLPARDRCLLELRFRVGLTLQDIGALTGRSRSSVSRRLSAVNQRLHDPIVQALQRHATDFDKEELDIALLHFAGGQGVNQLIHDRCLPRGRILNILGTVRGWHRHLRAQPCPVPTPAATAPRSHPTPHEPLNSDG